MCFLIGKLSYLRPLPNRPNFASCFLIIADRELVREKDPTIDYIVQLDFTSSPFLFFMPLQPGPSEALLKDHFSLQHYIRHTSSNENLKSSLLRHPSHLAIIIKADRIPP